YPRHTTHRRTDKRNEQTRPWNNTYDATSTTNRTIGYNCCPWHSLHITAQRTRVPSPHHFTPTTGTHPQHIENQERPLRRQSSKHKLKSSSSSTSDSSRNWNAFDNA